MNDDMLKIIAVAGIVACLLAGGLAIFHQLKPAIVINSLIAFALLLLCVPYLIAWAHNPGAFVRHYGAGATQQLRYLGIEAGLALIAIAAGGMAWRRWPPLFWPAWVANLPAIALIAYFAFWFHIF